MSEVLPEGQKKKRHSSVDFMEEHLIIMSLRSYPQILVFAACKVNRDVWYGATNLMSCKIKTKLCRWIWEDRNFHVCHDTLLRDSYGVDYIWDDLKMSRSMHTYFLPSYCHFTIIQRLASVLRYLCWQHKLVSGNISKYLNVIFKIKGGGGRKEREKDKTLREISSWYFFLS